MRRLFLIIQIMAMTLYSRFALGDGSFIALCYHDVRPEWNGNPYTITRSRLVEQFTWLKENNFHPVSLQALIESGQSNKPLPENPVLLTFDDGYASFHDTVFPILQAFGFPAVVSPVTAWLETETNKPVQYGSKLVPREHFLSWNQLKKMLESGLIEIASHSHDSHRGIPGNPQGSMQPALTTRMFKNSEQRYETDAEFQTRVSNDIAESVRIFRNRLDLKPKAITWPYGSYSLESIKLAEKQGINVSLTLDDGWNAVNDMQLIHRYLIDHERSMEGFKALFLRHDSKRPVRLAHVDMDYIYDPEPLQIQRNLDLLLDRIKRIGVNTVYLQAFSDPDGDGNADALYFPNRHLPMRADLFNYVAWQLRMKTRVSVYAWLPVLSFSVNAPEEWWVHELKNGRPIPSRNNYKRLSPYHPEARQLIADIYQDLAKQAHFSGLLFHDDAFLTDFEDVSPPALAHLKNQRLSEKTEEKIIVLTEFTHHLTNKVRYFRPDVKTARNLYANVVLTPESSEWFAQSLPDFLVNYDYTALMAMPFMEEAEEPMIWLETLIDKVSEHSLGLKKTVFELQSVDWRTQQKIPASVLADQMRLLQRMNALNYGYYPDDFHKNHPPMSLLKEMMTQ